MAAAVLRQPHYDGPHALVRLTAPAFLATVFDASRDSASSPRVGSRACGNDGKSGGKPVKAAGAAAEGQLGTSKLYKAQDPAVWLVACIDPASPACVQVCRPLSANNSHELVCIQYRVDVRMWHCTKHYMYLDLYIEWN